MPKVAQKTDKVMDGEPQEKEAGEVTPNGTEKPQEKPKPKPKGTVIRLVLAANVKAA